MSANAESAAQGGRCLETQKLVEVVSFEVPVKSVGTVTGAKNWRRVAR